MEKLDPNEMTPLPVTLEDAHKEIRYLQRQVFNARLKLLEKQEKWENDKKALLGELRQLRKDLRDMPYQNFEGQH